MNSLALESMGRGMRCKHGSGAGQLIPWGRGPGLLRQISRDHCAWTSGEEQSLWSRRPLVPHLESATLKL